MMKGKEAESTEKKRHLPGRVLDRLLNSRNSNRYLALIILLIATIPRLFYISKGLLPNGVDEGIDIMAGRMWDFGYHLYSQVNTVQAPVMIAIYGIIEADPVIFRLFSALSSLVIMALVMWVGFRIGGRHVMVASGAFAALDLMFLHQARLATLDMFCLFWVALGMAFLVKFRQSGSKKALIFLGLSIGIASMIKLFGIIAAGSIGLILLWDYMSGWNFLERYQLSRFIPPRRVSVNLDHILIFVLTFFMVVLFVMTRYGVENVTRGILLNQLHRPVMPFTTRLYFFGMFMLLNALAIPFFIFGVKSLYRRPEGVILIISAFYLLWFMFQATTWMHHLIFLSPCISLTAGVGIIEVTKWWSRRRRFRNIPNITRRTVIYTEVLLILLAAIVGGAFSWAVKESGPPIQDKAADIVMEITDENDFIISGDPLIPAKAGRPVPPNLVNVAALQYPDITDDELNRTCIDYGVVVVILTYHLDRMSGFISFVEENYRLKATIVKDDFVLDRDVTEYRIFYLPIDSNLRQDPAWGSLAIEGQEREA